MYFQNSFVEEALDREKHIRDSGGSLEPPVPLPTHIHTVYYNGVFGAPSHPLEPPG
jgi:hypothetical protein